eukprot:5249085-Prymnesium_polylepis.1
MGDCDTVEWWLDLPGQHVDALTHTADTVSLLMSAAYYEQCRLIEMLLARNALVDLRERGGSTALMRAAFI